MGRITIIAKTDAPQTNFFSYTEYMVEDHKLLRSLTKRLTEAIEREKAPVNVIRQIGKHERVDMLKTTRLRLS